jgi:hypothetical protein
MSSTLPPAAGFSRRKFLAWLGLSGAGAISSGAATASASPSPEVILQKDQEGACGPCALANALLNGDAAGRHAFHTLPGANSADRVETLISRYGTRPSETYGNRRGRFVFGAGLTCEDMPFLANDVLGAAGLPRVRGDWLDQVPNEDERAHLQRVHGLFKASLGKGLPPVVEVRAFSADPSSSKPAWINVYAHWLALIGIEPLELPPKSSGFSCRFADSFTGRVIPGFAYAERFRPFMATRGFSLRPNGDKDWHWLSGHPYVLLDLPDVPLDVESRPWHDRTVVAFTYMIHRPAAA